MKIKFTIMASVLATMLITSSVDAAAKLDTALPKTAPAVTVTTAVDASQESPTERAISNGIRAAIEKDRRFSNAARNLQIVTKGDVVTVHGNVNSEAEKIRIKAIAQNATGVSRVIDDVTVKSATPNF